MSNEYDAVIVGSGPNGLSAAIELARAGLGVSVLEAKETIGGGARTEQLTEAGFYHDTCSAIHPVAVASPFFRSIELNKWGVEWIYPPVQLAHPLDDGAAALLFKSLDETGETLGADAQAYNELMGPLARQADKLFGGILQPVRFPAHSLVMLRFGLSALCSARGLADLRFKGDKARALFGGCAAHSILPLERLGTASFGLVLALSGHAFGWPCARGGSKKIADALVACLKNLGGEIHTGHFVSSMSDLPRSKVVMFDLTPRQVIEIAGERLPSSYLRKLAGFKYGPGIFKIDWALDGPVPWKAEECRASATVHIGGTIEEIAAAESDVGRGRHPERPFVLFAQQSLFDPTRAPEGKHTGWAYCHVPHGSTEDMTERIERQVERFAPGFRDLIRARHTMTAMDVEQHNPNMIGGDIGGGANNLRQVIMRPVVKLDPYSTPNEKIFICSSSTPPGGGVHGMCGYHAARSALARAFKIKVSASPSSDKPV